MESLGEKEKTLALIAPLFFNYFKDIIIEAERRGFVVDYFCDAPSNNNISKAVSRINKKLIKKNTNKYFNKDVLPTFLSKQYNIVLVIAGMTFSFDSKMIDILRDNQKEARFVIYQWDSERNIPYVRDIHHSFDLLYTFDRFDAIGNSKYRFLPLFYNQKYEELGKKKISAEYKYDCMYIGTAHPKKYYEINRISESLKPVWGRQFIYHYMPSFLKYLYHKVFAPEFKHAHWKEFMKEKVSTEQILNIMEQSRCVLDSPQTGQTGLTIRTLECLGAKKKMITVNEDIKEYDFYRPQNILVMGSSGKLDFDSAFFTEEYEELPEKIYKKYSIQSWLGELISVED